MYRNVQAAATALRRFSLGWDFFFFQPGTEQRRATDTQQEDKENDGERKLTLEQQLCFNTV